MTPSSPSRRGTLAAALLVGACLPALLADANGAYDPWDDVGPGGKSESERGGLRPPSPGPLSLAAAGPADPARFLAAFARAYHPGRSGQAMFVPRPGVYFTEARAVFNHGSPWEYDTRIPLFFYGPGQVRATSIGAGAGEPYDIAPTLAEAVGLPRPASMSGHVWNQVLVPGRPRPKALLVVVMDQVGIADLDRHAAQLPTLARWRREGADFPECRLDYLPAVTGVSHACVGTGAPPGIHGIVDNLVPDAAGTRLHVAFRAGGGKVDPHQLLVPTLAEVLDAAEGNRAVIASMVYADYAAVGLAGRGASVPGGDRDVVVWYDPHTGALATDPRWYRLPDYLAARNALSLLDTYGTTCLGHFVGDAYRIRETPWFARWEADNALQVMAREGLGADDVPDLMLVNLKSTDAFGHEHGHEEPGYLACLQEVDRFLAAAERLLGRRTGPGGFVAAVTADHGCVPIDGRRRLQEGLTARLDQVLGGGSVLGVEGYNVFLAPRASARGEAAASEVKRILLQDPDVLYAWTESEVRAAAARTLGVAGP